MNDREIAEIRRRLRPEKNNIGRIRGCCVNESHEIISEFNFNFGLISNDESEELLSLLRKTLSGSIGRNLLDIEFTNQQVTDSAEHELLSKLRNSSLSDDNAVGVAPDHRAVPDGGVLHQGHVPDDGGVFRYETGGADGGCMAVKCFDHGQPP